MNHSFFSKIRETHPLIHCITNYVTANDVANIILAAGGSPIMADHPNEAAEVASKCHGVLLNLGTLSETSMEAMLAAGQTANQSKKILVLDPVGIGASRCRTEITLSLLKNLTCTLIRGNASEIMLLHSLLCAKDPSYKNCCSRGVDTADTFSANQADVVLTKMKELAVLTKSIILLTGPIDFITDGDQSYLIRNGHPMMAQITGSGCMLDGLLAVFAAAASETKSSVLMSSVLATAAIGISGEIAYRRVKETHSGTASFRCFLIDEISKLDDTVLKGDAKIELR